MMNDKTCRRCGLTKPVDEFYVDSSTKDKHTFYCKTCKKRQSKNFYHDKKKPFDLVNMIKTIDRRLRIVEEQLNLR